MQTEINMWAVLLAALSTMVVGSVWYSKGVFGKRWMKLVGKTDRDMNKADMKPMVIALLLALVTAYVLAHVTYLTYSFYVDMSFFSAAMSAAFMAWLGFVAARIIIHHLFEERPMHLTALTLGHELVTVVAMAAIIGWMGV